MNQVGLLVASVVLFVCTVILPAQSVQNERRPEPIAAPIPTQAKVPETPPNQDPANRLAETDFAPLKGPEWPAEEQVEYAVIPARKSLERMARDTERIAQDAGIRAAPGDLATYARNRELEIKIERGVFDMAGRQGWTLVAVPNPSYNFYVFKRAKRAAATSARPPSPQSGQAKKAP